ncbi:MAG: hypothetical protein QOF21_1610 [Actinomycetota bacterium]|jgi:hypothetical protein
MAGSYKPYRRTAIAACAVGVLFAAVALTGPGVGAVSAAPATLADAGTASAIATSYKVNPTTASLSIGITFGTSLAGYTNNVAQAESRAIDLGIIGSTLAGEGCDGGDPTLPADQQPQALRADSRDAGAGQPKSENEKFAPVITKIVQADSSPNGLAETVTAQISSAGSPVIIEGAHSKAVTHLVNGVREAVATTDIAGITIAGVLELRGLHWSAIYRTGGTEATEGTFSIGSINVGGQALPVQDIASSLEQLNAALGNLGVLIVAPKAHTDAGIQFVDPMAIRIVPNATRDGITGGILSAIQPVRESLYDALLAQDCGNATYITVSDIAIGSITGAGSLSIELGGVQASSSPIKGTNFLLGNLPIPSLGNINDLDSFLSDTSSLGELPATDANPPTIVKSRRNAALAATVKGSRGGRLALVGGLGLLALLIVADRDRRMMRRAQRISTEV